MTLELQLPLAEVPSKLTAKDILTALRTRHPPSQWVFVEEVRAGTGFGTATWNNETGRYTSGRGEQAVQQRLDAWALQLWSPGALVAYEVKVSRSDFLREIKDPAKRAFAMLVSSEFYFVTPVKMVKLDEVPADCGLIEVYPDGRVRTKRKAPSRPAVAPPSWNFVGSLLRHQRREMYLSGPGHIGQCGGFGRYVPDERYGGKRWELWRATEDEWCAKEWGHQADCKVVTRQ